MKGNNYSWNKTLKFSWGHIIAFIALVFISYVAYMGDFYKNGGDFTAAAIKVLIDDIAILIVFIGAQIYKGADEKFNRSIVIERILICLCPIVFVCAMLPYNHFWTVFKSRDAIETGFASSIDKSRQLFDGYQDYADARIASYEKRLNSAIANKETDAETHKKAGFNGTDDVTKKQVFIETLRLQLLSQNIDSLKNSAVRWINHANQGASVWNAFLVGNIDKISGAIEGWNKLLAEVSSPVLSNESASTKSFGSDMPACKAVVNELKKLQKTYTTNDGVSVNTIWTGVILFVMLLFPYFLQKRNTRATGLYSLLPTFKEKAPKRRRRTIATEPNGSTDDSDPDIYGGTF